MANPRHARREVAGRGRPQHFSTKENEVLRAEMRAYREAKGLSQEALADLLGVSQSSVSQLVGFQRKGMARETGNRLAKLLNYRDVEELLLERGVLATMREAPAGKMWGNRDTAVRIAQHLEYDQAAIDAIVARFVEPDYRTRKMKWWLTRIGEEETRLQAERVGSAQAVPDSRSGLVERPKKRRKKPPASGDDT